MNEILRRTIVIEYDVWSPFKENVKKEEDVILFGMKDKTFLAHAGNVKILLRDA